MLKQDITIEDKAGNKLTIHGQGKDVDALLLDMFEKVFDKKNKKFSAARRNGGTNLRFPHNGVFFNRYINKGVHAQTFLKNCNSEFKKTRHTDVMCMAKSEYSTAKMAEVLITSPSNIGNLKKTIFKKLLVTTMVKALEKLHKK